MRTEKFIGVLAIKKLHDKIYVVRTDSCIIYVGKAGAQSVPNRLCLHIRDVFSSKNGGSCFSKYLFSRHPDYFDWYVDIYSSKEVATLVKNTFTCLSCAEKAIYKHHSDTANKPVANAISPRGKCICGA
jgi:hypothetical protein